MEKKKRNPSVLLYTDDFIAGTTFMTKAQIGKYILALCYQHQKWELTEDEMNFICEGYDKAVFDKFIKTEMGFYYNERMREESIKRDSYVDSRRKNKAKDTTYDTTYENHMSLHMGNGNGNGIGNINKKEVSEISEFNGMSDFNGMQVMFENFWYLYDKKVGDKQKIYKKFCKLTNDELRAMFEFIPKYKEATPDKQFRKNPETFLNNKSWNDEIIKRTTTNGNKPTYTDTLRAFIERES